MTTRDQLSLRGLTRPEALCAGRRGSVVMLTMIFLVLFTTLALAFTASTNLNLKQAHNYAHMQEAQMAAEGGLGYMVSLLGAQSLPAAAAEEDLLLAVANATAAAMDGSANMGGEQVSFDGATIRTPSIPCQAGQGSFRAEIVQDEGGDLWLTITGAWQGVSRQVVIRLEPQTQSSKAFDYGIASKGKIRIGGNGTVVGVNDRHEADILSATFSDDEAVAISGSSTLDGDIATANPDSHVSFTGSPTIAGTSDSGQFDQYVHIGIGEVEFPEVDTGVFEGLAGNTLAAGADLSSDMVLENVRIPAGTNPKFTAGVTIRGVLYVEQPNEVSFAGHVNIQGVIATADAGEGAYNANSISFNGSVSSQGVETLPDQPSFAAIRQMPGSMLLAPGFGVEFNGSFDCLNGAIACDKFTMTGNAGGVIRGPIICYGDTEFELWGSGAARIDRSVYKSVLPGFEYPVRLAARGDSYREPCEAAGAEAVVAQEPVGD